MTRFRRSCGLLVSVLVLVAAVSGCGGGTNGSGSGSNSSSSAPVTLTWWNNANTDPGLSFWNSVVSDFHKAHPNITVTNVPMQNEQFNTKIPVALQSTSPPDIYQQWGGGALATQVGAGKVLDITNDVKPWIGQLGNAVSTWQVNGKQYGIPYNLGVVGFWYNKDLFAKASISSPPATWDDLLSDIQKLKAAGIVPISIGGQDRWPDAFYWDYLAVRECSKSVLQQAAKTYNLSDSCWMQAGQKVQQLLDAKPFQAGFLATSAQQGAGSSAGLIGNGKAAMELQGQWDVGVMNGLTPSGNGLGSSLGWFAFPSIPGGKGVQTAALGGGDGFSCSYKAPRAACVAFLQFIASADVQKKWTALNVGLPTNMAATSSVADPNLKNLITIRNKVPYVQLYLDQAFSTSVGQALDSATADQFAGTKSPQQVVKAITDAAANQ
jgi:raffinose/stachyose/melibiose transport system substrate-binding protein